MSKRYKGGIVSKDGAAASASAASGIWILTRAMKEIAASTWPTDSLFAFTTFTFQPIVSAGSATGPTLTQMQTAYSGQPWLSSYFALGTYQGYQRWTVPASATYTIECGGGMGGDGLVYYGSNIGTLSYGALISGNFSLTKGHVLEIVVGVKGGSSGGAHGNENGGGGGTFVRNVTTNTLLIVAGGAGGMPSPSYGTSCTRDVTQGRGQSGNNGAGYTCNWAISASSGGSGGYTTSAAGQSSYSGAAGGGFTGNGQNGGTHCSQAIGGLSFSNGLIGGAGNTCYDSRSNGGFGGGGGGMLGGPGGGGGYSGGSVAGDWSSYSNYGGGGGSYNVGTSQINTAGGNTGSLGGSAGAGYCKITKL